jgi:hypothetical protein
MKGSELNSPQRHAGDIRAPERGLFFLHMGTGKAVKEKKRIISACKTRGWALANLDGILLACRLLCLNMNNKEVWP